MGFDFTDSISGRKPTRKQLEALMVLNPFERKVTYEDAGRILGVSKTAIYYRMYHLRKRCPNIHKRFMELKKFFNRPPYPVQFSQLCNEEAGETIEDCISRLKIKRTF